MKMMRSWMVLVVAGLSVASVRDVVAESKAPAFSLADVQGVAHSLEQYAGKIVVLEWTNYECPFVKKFYSVGAMQAHQEKYTSKGVVWLSVCSSAPGKQGNFSNEEWLGRMKKQNVKASAVLLDPDGKVGRLYGAKNTPHFFIIDSQGNLAYQGAIDDKRSTKPADIEGARNYVVEVLDALLQAKPVDVAETKPYGCSVKY